MSNPDVKVELLNLLQDNLTPVDWKELAYNVAPNFEFVDFNSRFGLLDYIYVRQLTANFIQKIISMRPELRDQISKNPTLLPYLSEREEKKPRNIKFVNREYELNQILYPTAPAYTLVVGSPGYGKTELLLELNARFEADGWWSAYIDIEKYPTIELISKELLSQFKLGHNLATSQNARELGQSVAAITAQAMHDKPKRISILLDCGKSLNSKLLELLVKEYIPGMQEELYQDLGFFQTCHNPLRVVIACRYSPTVAQWAANERYRPFQLEPFNYNVVEMTVNSFLESVHYPAEYISKLASHLLYFTGGHPRCISRILDQHSEKGHPSPDRFFLQDQETKNLVVSIVNQAITELLDEIDPVIRKTFLKLGIFRKIDHAIIENLLLNHEIEHDAGSYDLEDKLTSTYLVARHGYLLQDDITRRLITIYLRQHMSLDEYKISCEKAKKIYEERLADGTTRTPYVWAIDYLFECIQIYSLEMYPTANLSHQKKIFFEEEVPRILNLLKDGRDWKVERLPLQDTLQNDWEFMFNINYLFKNKDQGLLPFDDLLKIIENS